MGLSDDYMTKSYTLQSWRPLQQVLGSWEETMACLQVSLEVPWLAGWKTCPAHGL